MRSQQHFLFRRRQLIAGAVVIAASALLTAPLALRSTQSRVRRMLEDHFGRDVVSGEAADRFIADISKKLDEPRGFHELVVHIGAIYEVPLLRRKEIEIVLAQFLNRTNAYRRYCGVDDELVYVSDPYDVGCGSFLAAQFKPDSLTPPI